jgi:hypothetical protein
MDELKEEIWKSVAGHSNHQVSSLGRIRIVDRWIDYSDGRHSFNPARMARISIDSHGYPIVRIDYILYRVHRLVGVAFLGLRFDQQIDHINRDRSDSRAVNLRACSNSENSRNCGLDKSNSSGFKGVSWDRANRKWKSAVTFNHKSITIGRFSSKQEAAKAYDKKAVELFGAFAFTNFPRRIEE